jgi:iron(III) transport system substrate-binding protein
MNPHGRTKTAVILFCCLVVWHFGISCAFSQSEHTAQLIEGAKKEGKLVWYTAMGASDANLMLEAFKKKYPFVVNVGFFRGTAERTLNRILIETRAGKWGFDLVAMTEIDILVHHKLISPYASPEAKAYLPEFKERDGYWTGIFANYYVLGYNTKLVSEKDAPKRWDDLLDPKWKGKISIDQEEYPWYATLLAAWGRERTEKYIGALAKQDIQWKKGHTLIAQLMAAGEFPVAIVYTHRIEEMKKKGAPVDWVNTLNPIVASVSGIGLSARPNNPNTAKLFIDFVLSREGQEMIRSFNRIPARSDVESLSPKLDQTRLKLKAVPQDIGTRYNEYVQEFRRIFGL